MPLSRSATSSPGLRGFPRRRSPGARSGTRCHRGRKPRRGRGLERGEAVCPAPGQPGAAAHPPAPSFHDCPQPPRPEQRCAASVPPRTGGRVAFTGPDTDAGAPLGGRRHRGGPRHDKHSQPRSRPIPSAGPWGTVAPRPAGRLLRELGLDASGAVSVRGREPHPQPRSLKPRLWGSREQGRKTSSPSLPCERGSVNPRRDARGARGRTRLSRCPRRQASPPAPPAGSPPAGSPPVRHLLTPLCRPLWPGRP